MRDRNPNEKKKCGLATKERLISFACREFAERGFRDARILDICRAAGTNVSAVNYHFGGKEGLYKAVWDHAVRSAVGKWNPVTSSNDKDREWLYGYIRACVLSVVDSGPDAILRRLVANEMNNPSPFADEMLSDHLAPRINELEKRLRRMMGPYVTDFQVGCCILAIHSQFSALTINKSARQHLFLSDTPTEEEAAHFVREICAFVMGGIRAMRGVPQEARRSHLGHREDADRQGAEE